MPELLRRCAAPRLAPRSRAGRLRGLCALCPAAARPPRSPVDDVQPVQILQSVQNLAQHVLHPLGKERERRGGWGRGTPGSSWPRQVSHPEEPPAGSWKVLASSGGPQTAEALRASAKEFCLGSLSGSRARGSPNGACPPFQTPHSCSRTGDTPTRAPPLVGIRDSKAFIAYIGAGLAMSLEGKEL